MWDHRRVLWGARTADMLSGPHHMDPVGLHLWVGGDCSCECRAHGAVSCAPWKLLLKNVASQTRECGPKSLPTPDLPSSLLAFLSLAFLPLHLPPPSPSIPPPPPSPTPPPLTPFLVFATQHIAFLCYFSMHN